MISKEVTIPVRLRIIVKDARDLDRFMRELRYDLCRTANQANRQKRNHVSITEYATVQDTYS